MRLPIAPRTVVKSPKHILMFPTLRRCEHEDIWLLSGLNIAEETYSEPRNEYVKHGIIVMTVYEWNPQDGDDGHRIS